MKKSNYLSEIEATYRMLDDSFDAALAKAADEEERKMLSASRDAARDAFWSAVEANLTKNSIFIDKLYDDLKTANNELKAQLTNLKDVKTVIKAVEDAVRLAAALAAFFA